MNKENEFKTKLSEIDEIPVDDFLKIRDLINKGRYRLRVNMYYLGHLNKIKNIFKKNEYYFLKTTDNLAYTYMLLIALAAILTSNYNLLVGVPIFLILKNSGIFDIWIIVTFSIILLIIILIFKFSSPAFYIILAGSYLTYITSKITASTYIKKLKSKSLKTETNFSILFQLNLIGLTDTRKNIIYEPKLNE